MGKFYNTLAEEQETIINIDYSECVVIIYTSQKSVYQRLVKKLGQPKHTYFTKAKISGAFWSLPFEQKMNITQILSRPTLVENK